MKTLYSSFSNTIIPNKNDTLNFCCSRPLNHTRHVLPWKKVVVDVGFFHLLCVKNKPFSPVRVHSSLSPESKVDLETTDGEKSERDESKMVRVKFLLKKDCSFGQQFAIVGNDPLLGSWDPENAILLKWSDGHVWTVELDVPIGTTIEYKFLLKGIAGDVLWQPGPDRVLETWECSNPMVVLEDWEDAALQNVADKEGSVFQNEESSTVENEMLLVSGGNGQLAVSDNHEKEQSVGDPEKSIVADNIALAQENPLHIITHNICNAEEMSAENASNEVLGEDSIRIVSHLGDPVLMSGLTPLPAKSEAQLHDESEGKEGTITSFGTSEGVNDVENLKLSEVAPRHDELEGKEGTTTSFGTSEGVNDVENHKLPELEAKPDVDGNASQEERIDNVNHEEQLVTVNGVNHREQVATVNGVNHGEQLATVNGVNHEEQVDKEFERKQHDPKKPDREEVFRNDNQWGRKTLQKLLANFGLM